MTAAPVLSNDDPLKEKQEELDKVYKEISKHRMNLIRTKRQEQDVMHRLTVINKEIRRTSGQLDRATGQIKTNERRLDFLKTSLNDASTKLKARSDLLSRRLKEIYKNGGVNFLEMLFSSDSLSNFINKSYYFEKLMGRDAGLVRMITDEQNRINRNKQELEGVTTEIKQLARVIETKKTYMERQAEEKNVLYKQLERRRKEYESKLAVLEETSNQIEDMIKKIMAERGRKELATRGTGTFVWPLRGRITSVFGYRRSPFSRRYHRHTGLDIANSYGTPILAADSGEIIFTGWWDGYGKAIIIDHGKGITTVYAHLSRIYVQKDQGIKKGQVVGLVGSTGYSTGPHLHFEVRVNGTPQNPIRWLN